jgi:putative hydrolase of the HAD superfamily
VIDLRGVRGWVFDIDDTLYLESDYVMSGFMAVGRWIKAAHGIHNFAEAAIARFERGARGTTFNLALADIGVEAHAWLVAQMVREYRTHAPEIALPDDARSFITRLVGTMPIAIISDGPLDSQSRKVTALGLNAITNVVLLTDRWGPQFSKPHERAFCEVESALNLRNEQLIYFADNPAKDFHCPHARGWQTVRIRRPGGQHHHVVMPKNEVGMEVTSFAAIEAILPRGAVR